jgi:hypothetical protein
MKSTIALLLGVLVLSACSSSPITQVQLPTGPTVTSDDSKMPPAILGNWRSVDAEAFGKKLFMTREYHLTSTRWEMIQTFAEDKAMKHTIAILHNEGPYQMLVESPKLPGVWTIQMKVGSSGLVLKTKKGSIAKELGINNCSLPYNHDKDITDRGCGPFPPLKECPQIFDLVKIDSNYLLFGAQPADMKAYCTESGRPTALGLPLRKIN